MEQDGEAVRGRRGVFKDMDWGWLVDSLETICMESHKTNFARSKYAKINHGIIGDFAFRPANHVKCAGDPRFVRYGHAQPQRTSRLLKVAYNGNQLCPRRSADRVLQVSLCFVIVSDDQRISRTWCDARDTRKSKGVAIWAFNLYRNTQVGGRAGRHGPRVGWRDQAVVSRGEGDHLIANRDKRRSQAIIAKKEMDCDRGIRRGGHRRRTPENTRISEI